MLHVEPFSGCSPWQFVDVQSCDKQLRRHGFKQLKQAFAMFAIELRGRVIDQEHHLTLPGFYNKVRLCDYQRGGQQFLLAARDMVTEYVPTCRKP
jgi:hypothetical protein